jgi:hypothetical protein
VLESSYQAKLIRDLRWRFPGAVILKNDTSYLQGIPDLTVLHGNNWAVLEVKAHKDAPHQPNQDYYVQKLNEMSFSDFIYPENEEVVLRELEQAFSRANRR